MDKKTIRNIAIFSLVALASGWLGVWIDQFIEPQSEGETPGMAVWLILPLLTTILLRLFAGDGWKDLGFKPNLSGNVKWYFISIIIFPIVTLSALALGKIFGWISFADFETKAYMAGFLSFLIPNFIKNVFEESVWRGYLTAKLLHLKIKDLWVYLIVGLVWGIWHLPYYLFFLPQSDMYQVLPVDKIMFATMAIFSMICWSIMFVELYHITKSIWPVVLLHMMEDSVLNHLVIDGYITIASGKEILISPIAGIITSLFYVLVGLLLRRARITEAQNNTTLKTLA
jgi:membrane protease YdiL (CAAX protease family)